MRPHPIDAQQSPGQSGRHDTAPEAGARWSYPAVAKSVRRVRNDLVDFAEAVGVADPTVEAIRLTSSEAAANVVEHAYNGKPGLIEVCAGLDWEAIWVNIADGGRGLAFGNRGAERGLGLVWMAWFSDSLTLVPSEAGGLEVRLRFGLN
jgi:anti-sigma regulatory factor (Ser/Thr protein kinase)